MTMVTEQAVVVDEAGLTITRFVRFEVGQE